MDYKPRKRAPGGGRKRKPRELHQLDNTINATKHNGYDLNPVFGNDLSMPVVLTDGAVVFWEKIQPLLAKSKVLTQADTLALAMVCEELSLYQKMVDAMSAFGATENKTDKDGNITTAVNGYAKVRAGAYSRAMQGLAAFGMTPSDRTRIFVSQAKSGEESPYAKIDTIDA